MLAIQSWWKLSPCSRISREKVIMITFAKYSYSLKDHCCVHSISPKNPPNQGSDWYFLTFSSSICWAWDGGPLVFGWLWFLFRYIYVYCHIRISSPPSVTWGHVILWIQSAHELHFDTYSTLTAILNFPQLVSHEFEAFRLNNVDGKWEFLHLDLRTSTEATLDF